MTILDNTITNLQNLQPNIKNSIKYILNQVINTQCINLILYNTIIIIHFIMTKKSSEKA